MLVQKQQHFIENVRYSSVRPHAKRSVVSYDENYEYAYACIIESVIQLEFWGIYELTNNESVITAFDRLSFQGFWIHLGLKNELIIPNHIKSKTELKYYF